MDDLQSFSIDMQVLAHRLGAEVGTPVTISAIGLNGNGDAIERRILISYEQPLLPNGPVPYLWYNPSNWEFHKSTNWRESPAIWELMTDRSSLFDESQVGQFTGGTLTSPLHLARNPVDDNEAVTKVYVDIIIAALTLGNSSLSFGEPVATVTALRQIDVSLVPDKQVRYVESLNRIFGYDMESVAQHDGEYVIAPVVGIGRWLSTDKQVVDGGTLP